MWTPEEQWRLDNFEPHMIHVNSGGDCKQCGAWVAMNRDDHFATAKLHVQWHKQSGGDGG